MKKILPYSMILLFTILTVTYLAFFEQTNFALAKGGTYSCKVEGNACVLGLNSCEKTYKPGNKCSTVEIGLGMFDPCKKASFDCKKVEQNQSPTPIDDTKPPPKESDDAAGERGFIPCGGLNNPCQLKHIFVLLHNIIDLLMFKLGPAFATLMIAYGGFKIMVSSGSPGARYKGKEIIKWALLGYGLMLLAWVIVNTFLLYLGFAEWTNFKDWWNINI